MRTTARKVCCLSLVWPGRRRRTALRWVLKRGGCEPEEMGLGFALLLLNQEDCLVRAKERLVELAVVARRSCGTRLQNDGSRDEIKG